jgi:hypothetical protein
MSDILTTTATIDIEAAASADKPPRVSITAYNGSVMNVPQFGNTLIDLNGLTAGDSVTLLADHTNAISAVVGTGTPSKLGGKLTIEGTLTLATEAGRQLVGLARDGVRLQASVGVAIEKRERIAAGERIKANGQTVTAPSGGLLFVKAGALREISVTPVGADSATTVTVIANRGTNMSTNPIDENEIRAAERNRLGRIDELCGGDWGKDHARVVALRAKCIAGEIEVGELQGDVLKILRDARPKLEANHGGQFRPDETATLTAALCLSAGMSEDFVGKQFDERTMNAAVSKPVQGLGIHGVMRAVLRTAGKPAPDRFNADGIRATFEADRMIRAGGFSTLSLPGILGNVANKSMLESYAAMPTTWQTFCAVASNSDFKQHTRYRMTGSGAFSEIGKGGEIKHITHSEESYANTLHTEGAMIALTRQDIINDDLGALTKTPRILGRMSAIALEKSVFRLLLSNPGSPAFFSTEHANYSTSAGVLDVDALTAMEQAFLELVDVNGDPIMIVPRTLLVPPALSVTANSLVSSLELRNTAADTVSTTKNPHAGRFQVAVSPWLTNANLTNNSDTGYYLFAQPGDIAAMEVAFLDGNQVPTIESGDTDFNTLGMQWRAYHDFGVALSDYRAAVFYDGTT